MKTVYKYLLSPGMIKLQMPFGAYALSVHEQSGHAYLWALVDTTRILTERKFVTVPTGVEFCDDELSYLGTLHMSQDNLVFHVFEDHS